MSNLSSILVADFVPLANKGEEAILRGIEDMLGQGGELRLGLFDNVTAPHTEDNVTVFPWPWIFQAQGNLEFTGLPRRLHDMRLALQYRYGHWGRIQNLVSPSSSEMLPLKEYFEEADLVLVGHDGVFCTESCAVIQVAKQARKRVGILGASAVLAPKARAYKGWLYRRALETCDFCFFRERFARDSLGAVVSDPSALRVAPDPAFAMAPAPASTAESILNGYASYRNARQEGRPVMAATVLEKGRVFAGFRSELPASEKRVAHARYIAGLLKGLIADTDALVVFLPHAVEADASDIKAAQRVAAAMAIPELNNNTLILEQDLDARTLKALIRACDFLVGERTHSLIGAVGVATPFIGLTNAGDTRTHGIIGEMCGCEEHLINIEATPLNDAQQQVRTVWAQRQQMVMHLGQVMGGVSERLLEVAGVVCGKTTGLHLQEAVL